MRAARIFAGIATLIAAAIPIAAAAAAPAARPACTTPPVSTPAGRFCGLAVTVTDEGGSTTVYAYEGIRYGTAKRWMAPVLYPPVSALLKATAFGPICPQHPIPGVRQSEECLFLNIWTPTRNSARNLPVMVFIHPGSFDKGAGSMPIFDGARLAGWGGAVVVTFNYRLGALGFLAGGSGVDHLDGNYGFEDQQLALEWVQRNIRSFGGNPAKVTLFGESAGAISIGAHLVAPASQPLFRNAIMESNSYGIPFKTFLEAAAIRLAFDASSAARQCRGGLACLEKLPAATIIEAQDEVQPAQKVLVPMRRLAALLAWAPYVDGRVVPSQPNQAVIARPVIAGTTRDEGTLFVYWPDVYPDPLPKTRYMAGVAALFGLNAIEILAQPRYQPNDVDNRPQLSNLMSDYLFSCAARHVLARATGRHFGYAFNHPPSYAVWPQAPAECQPGPKPQGRVCHTFELPFVFRNPVTLSPPFATRSFTRAEQKLVDAISAYWTDFALAGDPNAGAAAPPRWPAYSTKGIRQVLNLTISQTSDAALNCPLWDRIGYGKGAASLY